MKSNVGKKQDEQKRQRPQMIILTIIVEVAIRHMTTLMTNCGCNVKHATSDMMLTVLGSTCAACRRTLYVTIVGKERNSLYTTVSYL